MKKLFYCIIILCSILTFAACNDDKTEGSTEIEWRVKSQSVSFPALSVDTTLSLDLSSSITKIENQPSWIKTIQTISSVGSISFRIVADENVSSTERSCTITLYAESSAEKLLLTITQKGKVVPNIPWTTKTQKLGISASAYSDVVKLNLNGQITNVENKSTWIKSVTAANNGNGVYAKIEADSNPNSAERTDSVVIYSESSKEKLILYLTQEGKKDPVWTYTSQELKISASAYDNTVSLNLKGQITNIENKLSWVRSIESVNNGNGVSVRIVADENSSESERSGEVVITAGQTYEKLTLTIKQSGKDPEGIDDYHDNTSTNPAYSKKR